MRVGVQPKDIGNSYPKDIGYTSIWRLCHGKRPNRWTKKNDLLYWPRPLLCCPTGFRGLFGCFGAGEGFSLGVRTHGKRAGGVGHDARMWCPENKKPLLPGGGNGFFRS